MVYGNPARKNGWICGCGVKLSFSKDGEAGCAACGKAYKKQGIKDEEKVKEANK